MDVRRNGMRPIWMCGLMVWLVLGPAGCMVSKDKYEAATADMEAAKVEVEKSRMLRDALEQQIQSLKNQNDKMATDLEMMSSEVQRIKESRENERVLLDSREVEMGKKTKALASKMGGLQREYQKIKSQNRALKDTVVRYQKELKEARKDKAMKSAPPSSSEMAKERVPQKSSPSVKSVRKETVAPVAASLKGSLAPVNINSASANDLVLFLGLTKEMAEKVVANRPYRLRGELVAKNVIPKATFDVIKDRISASQ